MIAAYQGHQDIVELLLDYEADVSIADKFGKKA
jgi:ankyrin repeat protein